MIASRMAAKAAAALLVAALLAYLLINARSIDPAAHSRVIADLSKIHELDSELDEIVLKLRDALLSSYDPVVATLSRINAYQRDLGRGEHAIVGRGEAELDQAMVVVARRLEEKEALIERFKSRNALLRNSFYYFPLSVEALSADAEVPPELRAALHALLRDVLLLRLGATQSDYELIGLQIDRLRRDLLRQAPSPRAKLENVLQHAQQVLAHQIEVDRVVRDITATDMQRAGNSLGDAYNRVFERKLKQANLYRFILLVVSMGLLAYAVTTFRRVRQSEDRYRRLFEQHPHPMWLYDPVSLAVLAVNESAMRHYGYSRQEFLSMTLKDLRPAEDVPALLQAVERPGSQGNTFRHRKKDGSLIHVDIASRDFQFSDRAARLVLANDVTEKMLAEEQLRLAARALENTAEGVMIFSEQRRIIFVNRAFTRITGYSFAEAMGQNADFLRSTEDDAGFDERVWSQIRDTGSWQGEVSRRRKDGAIYPEWRSISAVRDAAGNTTHFVAVFSDISQANEAKERLQFLAHHDALTGLPNRVLFKERVQEALNRANRHGRPVGVLFIDLDRFKDINDSLGHAMGDQLLQAVTTRLKACVRATDIVARLGGDEFTVLVEDLGDSQHAARVAEKVRAALADAFVLGGQQAFVSASIGVTCYPQDGSDAETLLKNADAAMYRAKESGRDNFQFFSAEMNARALDRLVMTNSLRAALERDEFRLHYQPIFDLASGRLNAVEALVRWQHPKEGLVPPGRFIPIAEETGLIAPLGEWVLRTACARMKAWIDAGIAPRRMAVNLSARQFKQKDLTQRIAAILQETGLAPQFLELELTESMVMADPAEAEKVLHQLHDSGITLAIDDFGTGYSSLSYLKRFPIDFLKIDRSFVRDIPQNTDDVAIARSIIALAKGLDLRVIAEGVETQEQRTFLDMEGCEEAQGYLLGKPAAADAIERMLREPHAR
jgi:diguanylate cyclase (GGDEF)-like protein/PAS domain S-box-containing protein